MFAARDLEIQLALNGDTFDGSNNVLTLSGLRAWATIQATAGGATPFFSQAQIRIEGMLGSDMAQLSTLGLTSGYYTKNAIQVSAASTDGDGIRRSTLVFAGQIFGAYVDYNAQPDVGVVLSCSSTFGAQLPGLAPSSYKGSVAVSEMLKAICAATSPPLKLVNNGVTAVLANHAVGGSAMNQIIDICLASLTNYAIVGDTLYIWPQGSTRDGTIITLSSTTGMKGYPMYSAQGIDVEMEFNPDVELGRQMTVISSIPAPAPNAPGAPDGTVPIGANGTYYIYDVAHELSSNVYNGPWFTKAKLGTSNTQLRAS